jgi:hypothetical protein
MSILGLLFIPEIAWGPTVCFCYWSAARIPFPLGRVRKTDLGWASWSYRGLGRWAEEASLNWSCRSHWSQSSTSVGRMKDTQQSFILKKYMGVKEPRVGCKFVVSVPGHIFTEAWSTMSGRTSCPGRKWEKMQKQMKSIVKSHQIDYSLTLLREGVTSAGSWSFLGVMGMKQVQLA